MGHHIRLGPACLALDCQGRQEGKRTPEANNKGASLASPEEKPQAASPASCAQNAQGRAHMGRPPELVGILSEAFVCG